MIVVKAKLESVRPYYNLSQLIFLWLTSRYTKIQEGANSVDLSNKYVVPTLIGRETSCYRPGVLESISSEELSEGVDSRLPL